MLCLGWAGGNSGAFKNWEIKNTEILKVELPARNNRFNEKPMHDVNLLAKKIAQALDVLGYVYVYVYLQSCALTQLSH
jgi:surfactin synthase thioesterase subunit